MRTWDVYDRQEQKVVANRDTRKLARTYADTLLIDRRVRSPVSLPRARLINKAQSERAWAAVKREQERLKTLEV